MTSPSVTPNTTTFPLCVAPYSGNSYVSGSTIQIPCAGTSSFSGTQLVATLTFTASSVGSPTLNMTSGSDVQASGSSVFNGTLPSASFSVANAPAGGGGGGTTGGGTTGGGTTGGGTSGGTKTGGTSGGTKTTGGGSTSTGGGSTSTSGGGTTPTQDDTSTDTTQSTTATAALTIVVTDNSGKPIEGAKVVVDGRYNEYTDAKGTAGFTGLPVGSHTVSVSASGRATTQSTVSLAANDTKQVSLKLASAGVPTVAIGAGVVALVVVVGGIGLLIARRSRGNSSLPGVSVSGMVVGSADSPAVRIDSVSPSVVPPSSSLPSALSQTPPELPQTPLAPPPSPQPAVPPAQQLPPAMTPPVSPLPPSGPQQPPQQ
jgi:hypothetical protein